MKAHGTYLVPTLTVYEVFYAAARDQPELLTPGTAPKELATICCPNATCRWPSNPASRSPTAPTWGKATTAWNSRLLIGNGMTPIQALFAATRNAADLIGAADRIGSVQPGRYADMVAAAGNPLDDPQQFRQVSFVMKGGTVYRRDGARNRSAAELARAAPDGDHAAHGRSPPTSRQIEALIARSARGLEHGRLPALAD